MRPALVAILLLAGALPATAGGAPYTAPGNKVLWGGQGGYTAGSIADFERQSGKHPAVFNFFIDWGAQDGWLGGRLEDARRQGSLAISPSPPPAPRSALATSPAATATASWFGSTA